MRRKLQQHSQQPRHGSRAKCRRSRRSCRSFSDFGSGSGLHLTPTGGCSIRNMTSASIPPPRQLRLIIETDAFDDAVRFYRDVLGMPEQPAFATEGDDRVSILHAGIATIELATPTHVRNIDEIEHALTAPGPALRIALEVDDTERAVAAAQSVGADVVASPTRTPFQTINARVQGPAGWQVTFFQELETLEERTRRKGFSTDQNRGR